MEAFTQPMLDAISLQASTAPMYWFCELIADQTEDLSVGFRIVNAPEMVEFPTGSGHFWDPCAFTAPSFRLDSQGTIPIVELVVGDPAGEILTWCERGDGFTGRPATIWMSSRSNLSTTDNALKIELTTGDVTANEEALVFSLGVLSLLSIPFPKRTFQRDRCDTGFALPDGCFFQLPGPSEVGYGDPNIMQCDKTKNGPAGCRVHGDNEVARNLPRLHPLQFHGYPSIPLGPRR